jgi:hypothetical protein
MWLTAGRRAAIVWRQAGDPYVPATLAPRDHHRRLVSRGTRARAIAAEPGQAFNPSWARGANVILKVV